MIHSFIVQAHAPGFPVRVIIQILPKKGLKICKINLWPGIKVVITATIVAGVMLCAKLSSLIITLKYRYYSCVTGEDVEAKGVLTKFPSHSDMALNSDVCVSCLFIAMLPLNYSS